MFSTLQIFLKKRRRDRQKWLLSLNINIIILKSKLPSSIAWINPILPICYGIYKTPKLSMDYNVHNGILLGDANSKHIIIILVIVSWNFRKLQEWFSEFEWNENRTQKTKSNKLLIKRWNFSRMSILKAKYFISWAEGK